MILIELLLRIQLMSNNFFVMLKVDKLNKVIIIQKIKKNH